MLIFLELRVSEPAGWGEGFGEVEVEPGVVGCVLVEFDLGLGGVY